MQVVKDDPRPVSAPLQQASRIVTDPKMAAAIMQAMSDELSRRILSSAIPKGKSVEEISAESGIPSSTTYRRVHELALNGLMLVERIMFAESGRRYLLYRCAFRGVNMELDSGELRIALTLNEDVADRFHRIWQSIRSS